MLCIIRSDGFRIELCDCGGFNLFTPSGQIFAWAQEIDEAERKIEREHKERLFA